MLLLVILLVIIRNINGLISPISTFPNAIIIIYMHFPNLRDSRKVIIYVKIVQLFSNKRNIYLKKIPGTAMPPSRHHSFCSADRMIIPQNVRFWRSQQ